MDKYKKYSEIFSEFSEYFYFKNLVSIKWSINWLSYGSPSRDNTSRTHTIDKDYDELLLIFIEFLNSSTYESTPYSNITITNNGSGLKYQLVKTQENGLNYTFSQQVYCFKLYDVKAGNITISGFNAPNYGCTYYLINVQ